jgi:hypothetical protein
MTHRTTLRLWTLTVLTLIATGLLAQGLYYESETSGGMLGEKKMLSTTYLMPKMFKNVSQPDGDAVIIRMDQQKIYNVDPQAKTYSEVTFAEMEQQMKQMSATMDERMAKMEESMKDMPPEQRKMLEGMMGGRKGSKGSEVALVRTGDSKKVSGLSCTKYVAKEGEKELMTIWSTKEVRGFESLRKDYETLTQRMMSMNPSFMKGLIDAMQRVEGFPMETEWGGITMTVTKVVSRSTPASEFTVPAGYTKTSTKQMEDADEQARE